MVAADKATSRAVTMRERTGHSNRNWSHPSWVMFSGRTASFMESTVRLRRYLDTKAIQDRPLRPRIEAVSGAEPADEPNLREQDRLSETMAGWRGTVSELWRRCE